MAETKDQLLDKLRLLERLKTLEGPAPVYRTNPDTEAIQEAFPTSLVPGADRARAAQDLAPVQARMDAALQPGTDGRGATAGQALGGLPFGAPGAIVGGMAGFALERKQHTGEWPTWRELALEGGLTTFFEGAGRLVTAGLARLPAGRKLLSNQAAQEAQDGTQTLFQSKARGEIGAAFDLVKQSGQHVDVSAAHDFLGTLLSPDELKLLARKSAAMGDVPGRQTGWGQAVFEALQGRTPSKKIGFTASQGPGTPATLDIGLLQDYSSQILKEARHADGHVADVLYDFKRVLDLAIDDALARGGAAGATAQTLQQARKDYFLSQAQAEFDTMLTRPVIMKPSKDGRLMEFNLGRLQQAITQPVGNLEKAVAEKLHTTGHLAEVEAMITRLQKQFPVVELSVPGLNMVTDLLLTKPGRALFEKTIVAGRGIVDQNLLALWSAAVARPIAQRASAPESPPPAPTSPPN
jgi:hypothetical protein